MSTKEIDRLVSRYLDGEMSPAEEEEFFVRVALDAELRRSYQAQRIVESALRKGRENSPQPSPQGRARLVALTAAAATAAQDVAAARETTASTTAGSATSATTNATVTAIVSRPWFRDIIVAGTTLAVGSSLWLGFHESEAPERTTRTVDTLSQPAATSAIDDVAAPRRAGDSVEDITAGDLAGGVSRGPLPMPADSTTPASSAPIVTRGPEPPAAAGDSIARASAHAPASTVTSTSTSTSTNTSAAARPSSDSAASQPAPDVDSAPKPDTIRLDVRVKMS